jgi:hypothetical protein
MSRALTWWYGNRPQARPRQVPSVAAKISNQARDLRFPGAIAQLEEHLLCKQGVRGSSPLSSTTLAPPGVCQPALQGRKMGRKGCPLRPVAAWA